MRDVVQVTETVVQVPLPITARQLQAILDRLTEIKDTLGDYSKLLETTTLNTLLIGVRYLARTINHYQHEIIYALYEETIDLVPDHLMLEILIAGHR